MAGMTLGVSGTSAAADSQGGQRYYLDCAAGNDAAAGTAQGSAWRTLDHVNALVFHPGDSILLRSGTTCQGTFSPKGSGTEDRPIVAGSYGSGARPVIVADGARAVVFLHNVQYWELRNLDISDRAAGNGTSRTGIYVLLEDYGTGHHYVIDGVNVHHVVGIDATGPANEDSAGILFKATGSTVATGFDGIQVTGNTVSGVDGYGIATSSQWSLRPLLTSGTNTFVPISHVRIAGNRLSDLGGDGIVVQNGIDPLVEGNVIDGFGKRATAFHAGIWSWNSDRPVMQYNDVSHGSSSPPAFAFDVDIAAAGVLYQYNYSHENAGFMLLCTNPGEKSAGATIRYNVSENDRGALFGTTELPLVTNGCGSVQPDVRFYNNVIHTKYASGLIGNFGETAVAYSNNIFSGKPGGSTIGDPMASFDHNLYFNVTSAPTVDAHAVAADPAFVRPGAGPLGYLLKCGSPAIGAGVLIAGDTGHDFLGFPVPHDAPPNIGPHQSPCVHV
ncbi:right-handed parallel beta-helix repeat-containing protein [Streptomyces sp. So13.3]|uniref:right-handed parallel beta-helix repeat-containing protein n=1 Tax=Streptomyces TaxID=1883 RepID=UPI00164D4FF1|nr:MULTISPECIES: right-handed parallel beta-helix repeat-containing protein [Streptomyces]QNA76756.1 right-handed parallel beta-helix repeat-containing protein [Streptomyces sp. So13.3]